MTNPHTSTSPSTAVNPPGTRSRFWNWVGNFVFLGLIVGGLVIYFLPSIVARYIIRGEAAAWVTAHLSAHLEIGDATLGWQSPVLLHDVVVRDEHGQQLAAVSSITSRQSLWELLTDSTKPFEFELEGIRTAFIVKDLDPQRKRLALAQVIDQLMKLAVPQPQRAMTVTIVNGQFDLKNQSGELLARWSPIAARYQFRKSPTPVQTVTLHAPVASTTQPGEISLDATWQPDPRSAGAETIKLDAGWRQQPVAAFQPWIANFLNEEMLPESMDGKLDLVLNREHNQVLALVADAAVSPPAEVDDSLDFDDDPATIRIQVQTDFSRAEDTLKIPRFVARGADIAVDAQGEISDVSRTETIDLSGHVQSPGEMLMQLLPEEHRQQIEIRNVRITEFSIQGPLRQPGVERGLPTLAFTTEIGWDAIEAYQFVSEEGRLRIALDGNRITLEPIHVPVSGGHLRQLPTIELEGETVMLHLRQGPVLENVNLTEPMCRGWLKYVSPTLANATAADGRLTLSVEDSRFPLADIGQGELRGNLNIHTARFGPGPFAGEILALVGQIQEIVGRRSTGTGRGAWLLVDNQNVPFRVTEGRVFHENFAFMAGDMRVSTRGSVGLADDSLDLMLSMKIPDKWLADAGPLLGALQGETIDLAVVGTVDDPRIDAAPLAELGKRAGLKAAGGLLQQLLERRRNSDR